MAGLHQYINTFSKIQYFLITITSYSFFIIQAYQLYKSFNEKDTGTRINLESIENVQFPSFTICHLNFLKGYNEEICVKNGIEGGFAYINGAWQSNDSQKSPEQLYNEITFDPYDVVSLITLKFRDNTLLYLDKKNFTEKFTKVTDVDNQGKCLTLNIPKVFSERGIKTVSFAFDIEKSYAIYLHQKHQLYSYISDNVIEGRYTGTKKILVDFEVICFILYSDLSNNRIVFNNRRG